MTTRPNIIDLLRDAGADLYAAPGTHAHTLGLAVLTLEQSCYTLAVFDLALRRPECAPEDALQRDGRLHTSARQLLSHLGGPL